MAKRGRKSDAPPALKGQDGNLLGRKAIQEIVRTRASNISNRNLRILEDLLDIYQTELAVNAKYERALYELRVWEARKAAGEKVGEPPGKPVKPPPMTISTSEALKIIAIVNDLAGYPPAKLLSEDDPEKPTIGFDLDAFNALQRAISPRK